MYFLFHCYKGILKQFNVVNILLCTRVFLKDKLKIFFVSDIIKMFQYWESSQGLIIPNIFLYTLCENTKGLIIIQRVHIHLKYTIELCMFANLLKDPDCKIHTYMNCNTTNNGCFKYPSIHHIQQWTSTLSKLVSKTTTTEITHLILNKTMAKGTNIDA